MTENEPDFKKIRPESWNRKNFAEITVLFFIERIHRYMIFLQGNTCSKVCIGKLVLLKQTENDFY